MISDLRAMISREFGLLGLGQDAKLREHFNHRRTKPSIRTVLYLEGDAQTSRVAFAWKNADAVGGFSADLAHQLASRSSEQI
jgi:hypothetical protein